MSHTSEITPGAGGGENAQGVQSLRGEWEGGWEKREKNFAKEDRKQAAFGM